MWHILVILAAMTAEPYLAACGRSPIPQPDESIRHPLAFTRLQSPQTLPAPDGPVPWTSAHAYAGQSITVEGVIVDTHRLPNITFLNFHEQWQDKFYVVVFASAHDDAFRPETEYLNRKLRITGQVVLHRNRPQIQVSNLNQIEIIE